MPKKPVLVGLAAVAVVVAIVIARSGQPTPEAKPETAAQATPNAEAKKTQGAGKGKKHKGKHKSHHIAFRAVPKPKDPLDCPDCNVVLISIDTLRADHLGSYGYGRKTSPYLDKLAKQSIVFDNAISQSAWTKPAHASMMTGLLPREHGVLYHPAAGAALKPDVATLATTLGAAGYRSASWNGGGYVGKDISNGFGLWKSLGKRFDKNLMAARDWLIQHGDERFFLFVHGYDVHKPYTYEKLNTFYKPKGTYDVKRFCLRGNPEHKIEDDELQYMIAMYDASIVGADHEIGRFLNFLTAKGLMRNTIVIVTADHGDEFLEHGKCNHIYSVYRELTHVPLMIHLPSKLHKRVAGQVAASISLMPTVLGMLGLDKDQKMTFDLRPVVTGKGAQPVVISETGAMNGDWTGGKDAPADAKPIPDSNEVAYYKASVTTPELKLIYNRENDKDTWELYENTTALEQENLAGKSAARMAPLKKLLFPKQGKPAVPAMQVKDAPIDKDTLQTLRALGYVQ